MQIDNNEKWAKNEVICLKIFLNKKVNKFFILKIEIKKKSIIFIIHQYFIEQKTKTDETLYFFYHIFTLILCRDFYRKKVNIFKKSN